MTLLRALAEEDGYLIILFRWLLWTPTPFASLLGTLNSFGVHVSGWHMGNV